MWARCPGNLKFSLQESRDAERHVRHVIPVKNFI